MHATADDCTGGVHLLRGEGGIDRAEPDGQGATLRAGVKADPRNGAELAAQQPGRQPDRPEANDGQGVPPADLGAQQTFVGRAEPQATQAPSRKVTKSGSTMQSRSSARIRSA